MGTFERVDAKQVAAVLRCRAADQAPMMQMFEAALERTMTTLVNATDTVTVHRMQGRAQTLQDFLELVRTGDQILERLK